MWHHIALLADGLGGCAGGGGGGMLCDLNLERRKRKLAGMGQPMT